MDYLKKLRLLRYMYKYMCIYENRYINKKYYITKFDKMV